MGCSNHTELPCFHRLKVEQVKSGRGEGIISDSGFGYVFFSCTFCILGLVYSNLPKKCHSTPVQVSPFSVINYIKDACGIFQTQATSRSIEEMLGPIGLHRSCHCVLLTLAKQHFWLTLRLTKNNITSEMYIAPLSGTLYWGASTFKGRSFCFNTEKNDSIGLSAPRCVSA